MSIFYRGRYQCGVCLCLLTERRVGGKGLCLNDRCSSYRVWAYGYALGSYR